MRAMPVRSSVDLGWYISARAASSVYLSSTNSDVLEWSARKIPNREVGAVKRAGASYPLAQRYDARHPSRHDLIPSELRHLPILAFSSCYVKQS